MEIITKDASKAPPAAVRREFTDFNNHTARKARPVFKLVKQALKERANQLLS